MIRRLARRLLGGLLTILCVYTITFFMVVSIPGQRFSQGLISQIDVLAAQRSALVSQTIAVQVVNDRRMTTVALIKALGGGWQDRSVPDGLRSMWVPPLKR